MEIPVKRIAHNRCFLRVLFCFFACLLLVLHPAEAAKNSPESDEELLESSPQSDSSPIRVGVAPVDGFSTIDENGVRHGLIIDYLTEIAKYTGWHYEYVDYGGEELVDGLLEGEVDLIGGTYYSPSLEEYFAYPDYSCGSSTSILLARWEDTSIEGYNIRDLNGKTIGVHARAVENIRRLQIFLDINNLDCELHFFSPEELVDGTLYPYLEDGTVDLLLGNASDDNGQFHTVASFEAQPHYLVTTPDKPELLAQLNQALSYIAESCPAFADLCYQENFPDLSIHSFSLNETEQQYITEHPVITIALPLDFYPFCHHGDGLDTNGVVPEILQKITEFSSLQFCFLHTETYEEAVAMVQQGEAELLGFFLGDEADAAALQLALTQPYCTLQNLAIRSRSVSYPQDGLRCGILSGSLPPTELEADTFLSYPTYQAMLQAVSLGEIDLIYGLSPQIEHELQQNSYSNLVTLSAASNSIEVCFATQRPAQPELLTILNKALNSLSRDTIDTITNTNLISNGFSSYTLRNFIYDNPILTIIIVALFLLLILGIVILIFTFRFRSIRTRSALERTAAASEAKSQFLSQISHEIRTPMNGIMGISQLSRQHLQDPVLLESYLDMIDETSQHLLSLLNDVLDMAKIESGKIELHEEAFSLGQLLRQLQSTFAMQAQTRGIQYQIQLTGEIEEMLIGDSLRLSQILSNLLSNAMKFTPSGGFVTLGVQMLEKQDTKIRLRFSVQDTGCGIAPESQERIFHAFEQEHGGITRRFGGTGLGLSISQQFAKLMGGQIQVTSEVGVGSEFQVELPFGCQSSHTAYLGTGEHVLLIHSDLAAQAYLSALLRRENFLVITFSSAAAALDLFPPNQSPCLFCLLELAQAADVPRLRSKAKRLILVGDSNSTLSDAVRQSHADSSLRLPAFHSDLAALLQRLSHSAEHTSQDPLENCFQGLHILLVEDNAINMMVAARLLEHYGAVIQTAGNGKEAVNCFSASEPHEYDLILMDLQMPVMDGLQATREIRALLRDDAKTIPIFAMTANAMHEDAVRCLESGMNAHISKPFVVQDIYDAYQKVSSRR